MTDFFDVQVITISDLKSDQQGILISDLADVICEVFSEPPWNENFSAARIMFGLGVEKWYSQKLTIFSTKVNLCFSSNQQRNLVTNVS